MRECMLVMDLSFMGSGNKCFIRKDVLSTFAKEKRVGIKTLTSRYYSLEETAKRAESRVGEKWKYDRALYNCESFTSWAANGESKTHQGEIFFAAMAIGSVNAYKKNKNFTSIIQGAFVGTMIGQRTAKDYLYSNPLPCKDEEKCPPIE